MTDTKDFVLGVVIGSAIGAAAALLYAPQSGTETREQLRVKADEARLKAAEAAQQAQAKASEAMHQVQAKAGEAAHQVQAKAGEVTGQLKQKSSELTREARSVVDKSRDFVENQKEAVVTAVEAGKEAYAAKQEELKSQVADDTLPAVRTGAV